MTQAISALGGAGIITEADLKDFAEAERKIAWFMVQNEWVSEDQLIELTGQRQALRRMRRLRGPVFGVEKKKISKRGWVYKLVRKQGSLL